MTWEAHCSRASCPLGARAKGWGAVLLLLVLASPAQAIPVIAMMWRTADGSSAEIVVSQLVVEEIVADVVLRLDAGDEARGAFLSFIWDVDGQDELDLVGFRELPSVAGIGWEPFQQGTVNTGVVPSVESTAGVSGVQGGFESVAPLGSPMPASGPLSVTLGSVTFRTNPANLVDDGADVRLTALANGLDAFIFGDFVVCTEATPCQVGFEGASVIPLAVNPGVVAPEPDVGRLLAVAALLAGVRSARSGRARAASPGSTS